MEIKLMIFVILCHFNLMMLCAYGCDDIDSTDTFFVFRLLMLNIVYMSNCNRFVPMLNFLAFTLLVFGTSDKNRDTIILYYK